MAFVAARPPARVAAPPQRPRTCAPRASAVRLSRRAALSTLAAALGAGLAPALADHTYASARRSLDRYYPRMVVGVDQLREVRALVKDGGKVESIVDSKLFDVKLRKALSIYATSFSDNYLNKQSKECLACVGGFYDEIGKVKAAEGEEAVVHYNRAVDALNKYFAVARLPKDTLAGLAL